MEVPALEPYVGVRDNAEENMESKESCSSLARSDSGTGKSLSSVDFPEENIPPDESKRLEATTEIDDLLPNVTFEETTPLMKSNENALSNHARTVSSVCTNPDSGIEKSPVSQHFTFLNISNNQLQEFNSKDDISHRKHQKDMFEGPVSDLTDVSPGRSGKSSLQRQKSVEILHYPYPLDLGSFEKDKPIELFSNNINSSPEVSILSSADCNGNTAQTQIAANPADRFSCNVLHKMQAQTDMDGFNEHGNTVNAYTVGIQSGCGQLLTLPEATFFNYHMPSQGMVPEGTLDNMVKELTMAKRKIRELEYDNFNLRKNNAALFRENRIYENWQLQLQTPPATHPDVFWKNKYVETQEQLRIKESELQSKQDELSLRNADLARLGAMEEELQRIRFLSEGPKSKAPSDADQDLQHLLRGSLRLRPDLSSSDETQVKTT